MNTGAFPTALWHNSVCMACHSTLILVYLRGTASRGGGVCHAAGTAHFALPHQGSGG
jgi:hypothetical protein